MSASRRHVGMVASTVFVAAQFAPIQTVTRAFALPGGCGLFPNRYAQQSTVKDGYKGVYGRLEVHTPSVPNYQSAFSLSHVYPFYKPSGGSSFIETGWYKGYGTQAIAYPGPRDYTAKSDSVTPYTEYDLGTAGSDGSKRVYEVQYEDYSASTGLFIWRAYAGSLASPIQTWAHKDMAVAQVVTGAEVSNSANSGSQGFSKSDSLQLKVNNNTYSLWNPALMTARGDSTTACDDANLSFVFNVNYTQHSVTGTV